MNVVFVELRGVRFSPDHPFPRPPVFDYRPMLRDEIDCAVRHGWTADSVLTTDELIAWLEDDDLYEETTAACLASFDL